jgi:hypothetical protein
MSNQEGKGIDIAHFIFVVKGLSFPLAFLPCPKKQIQGQSNSGFFPITCMLMMGFF